MAAIARATPMCVRAASACDRAAGIGGWLRTAICAVPLLFGFVLPALLLLRLLARDWSSVSATAVATRTRNSLWVGCLAALVVVTLTLMLNARARGPPEVWALRGAPAVVWLRGAGRGAGDRRAAAADLAGRAAD